MRVKLAAALCIVSAMGFVSPVFAADAPGKSSSQVVDNMTTASNQRPASEKAPSSASPERASAPAAPKPASNADRVKYAERESASPEAKKFQGGDDVVVIGASTTALILGVILLVVLL